MRWRAFWVGGSLLYLMIWALAASASRGGALATVVGLVAYVVFADGLRGSLRRAMLTALGLGAVVLVLFNTTLFPVTLQDRVDRSLTADAAEQTTLLADRERLRRFSLRGIKHRSRVPSADTSLKTSLPNTQRCDRAHKQRY